MKKLTTKTCNKKRVEEKFSGYMSSFIKQHESNSRHDRAILDTTNSGHVKFKLRQESSCAYRDIADANGILLCV